MNKLNQKLQQENIPFELSSLEKSRMRAQLRFAMKQDNQPLPSPYYPWLKRHLGITIASSSFALLIILMGTTAYGATLSLPGDLLYGIKIHINEPIEVALSLTPTAKAETHATLARRRVVEAETLASRGELTATTTKELEQNFNENAQLAIAIADAQVQATTSSASSTTAATTTTPQPQIVHVAAQMLPIHSTATTGGTSTSEEATSTDESSEAENVALEIKDTISTQRSILQHLQHDSEDHSSKDRSANTTETDQNASSTAATSTINSDTGGVQTDMQDRTQPFQFHHPDRGSQ